MLFGLFGFLRDCDAAVALRGGWSHRQLMMNMLAVAVVVVAAAANDGDDAVLHP